jgi:hypothetical protein
VTAAPGAYTLRDFEDDFPDDARCLDWLTRLIFPEGIPCPKCRRVTPHHLLKKRRAYSCDYCGRHVHPTSFTRIQRSPTSLKKWFLAIYLLSKSRGRISAAQLARDLGVTYKTAWRIATTVRSAVAKNDPDDVEESEHGRPLSRFPVQVWTRERFFEDLERAVSPPVKRKRGPHDTRIDDALARRLAPREKSVARPKR